MLLWQGLNRLRVMLVQHRQDARIINAVSKGCAMLRPYNA